MCARILGTYRIYVVYISVVKTEPMNSSEIATTTTTDGSLDNFSGSGKEKPNILSSAFFSFAIFLSHVV